MDQNKLIELYQKQTIGVDAPFKFRCTMCGNCCRHREDILLNPYDFFRLIKGLEMKAEDVLEKYCECYIGENSRMPLIRLKPVGIDRRCSLLRGNRCAVHNFKPTVCAMFPIGRMISGTKDNLQQGEKKIDYVFTAPNCGDKKETHTVREWFEKFNIPLADEFFLEWSEVLFNIANSLCDLEKHVGDKSMSLVWDLVFKSLYMVYETDKEFFPQFEERTQNLLRMLDMLCKSVKEGVMV